MDVQAAKTLRKTAWALDFHCLFAPLGAHQPGFFRVEYCQEYLDAGYQEILDEKASLIADGNVLVVK